jgi:hypothetical protein
MAISNLTTQYISSSFQNLMQVSSSGQIYNGTGTQVTNLVLTSVTASFNGLINSASTAIAANTATSASYALTASYALSAAIDVSNLATTGSNTFIGNQNVTGNVSVTGTLTANTYILSSSVTNMTIEYASGSTAFGNSSDDTHTFIGSVTVTGSFLVSGSSTFRNIGPAEFTGSVISTQGFTGSLQGTATSASYAIAAGTALNVKGTNVNGAVGTASYVAGASVDGAVADSDRLGGLTAGYYALNTSITGFATTSSLSSYALTTAITGFATTSSLNGFATTGSNNFIGNQTITGSLLISGSIQANGVVGTGITTSMHTGQLIRNTFYTVDPTGSAITITLRTNQIGAEFTFFATNLTNDITFAADSTTIISEDSYLKMNKAGSAVTAKYYNTNLIALIGSLKA